MLITNENYRQALRRLKKDYSDLPWYQRWWFSLWANSLSIALSDISLNYPTTQQVEELVKRSDESWFFNSIFGLLTQFKETIGNLSFSGQPKEIKTEIHRWLPGEDLKALASTSKENYAFFESLRQANRFLHAVTHGRYNKVTTLLQKNINLLLHKGRFTVSGRTFFNISGFQYALWSLDKDMWIKMLECLPRNEYGALIKAKLLQQYQELEEKGVIYKFDGQRIRESHFDFENITEIEWLSRRPPRVERHYICETDTFEFSFYSDSRRWQTTVFKDVKTLCKLQTADFIKLKSWLEEPMALDDQFSASPQ